MTAEELIINKIKQIRIQKCGNCCCSVDFEDPNSACPNGKWGKAGCAMQKHEIHEVHVPPPLQDPEDQPLPSNLEMTKSVVKSFFKWGKNGIPLTGKEDLKKRTEICESCEFWSAEKFAHTGRCMKCGCATWFKLRMATEKCPIGKW